MNELEKYCKLQIAAEKRQERVFAKTSSFDIGDSHKRACCYGAIVAYNKILRQIKNAKQK